MTFQLIKHSKPLVKFAFIAVLLLTPAILSAQEKIAFESQRDGNHEIYIMNADGSSQTRLTNDLASDMQPAVSPDGSKIVFVSTKRPCWNYRVELYKRGLSKNTT